MAISRTPGFLKPYSTFAALVEEVARRGDAVVPAPGKAPDGAEQLETAAGAETATTPTTPTTPTTTFGRLILDEEVIGEARLQRASALLTGEKLLDLVR
ncbi:hypothetical protein TYRP_022529 [Tyrophagus putrescentiae]|nr:hypothetical protein TYRP_022529 [Tyrophagus putrescentiae]